ncbi:hypothetical protein ES705_42135 [subsurface metagenome]
MKRALELIHHEKEKKILSENIKKLALKNSAEKIAEEIIKLAIKDKR